MAEIQGKESVPAGAVELAELATSLGESSLFSGLSDTLLPLLVPAQGDDLAEALAFLEARDSPDSEAGSSGPLEPHPAE